jgi:hypothetical protein
MAIAMRYLTLAADYGEVAIRDEQHGRIALADLRLPEALITEIVAWNDRYQRVIPADLGERKAEPMASLISELDDAGRQLTERIAEAVGGGVRIKYFSEGLLREVT